MITPAEILAPLITAARTPAQREALAAELERIAALIRHVAEAQRRDAAKPAGNRLTPKARHAGPGRTPSAFIRVCREPWGKHGRDRLRFYVGRALWYAVGSPARFDLERLAGRLILRPAEGDRGIAFTAGKGMPRAFIDGWADVLRLDDGRYAAIVEAGAIVVGERL